MLIIVQMIWQWPITASMLYINQDSLSLFQCFNEFYRIITHNHGKFVFKTYMIMPYIYITFVLCFVQHIVL